MTGGEVLTLDEAIALTEIITAAQRKTMVAYLDGTRVTYGQAHYIGGNPDALRDMTAEGRADVRDLYLVIRLPLDPHGLRISYRAWLVRNLIAGYRKGVFVVHFDPGTYDEAGGESAVIAQACAACGSGTGPDRETRRGTGEIDRDTWAACPRCGALLCDGCDLTGLHRSECEAAG